MPSESFSYTVQVESDPEATWRIVTDVDLLTSWISILTDVTEHAWMEHYSARLSDRIGMFSLTADLDIRLTDFEEGVRVTLEAEGRDRQVDSAIFVEGTLRLIPSSRSTEVAITGRYEVTGRVATFGAPMIRVKAEKAIGQFLEGLASSASA